MYEKFWKEQAPDAIRYAGVKAVVAESFATIFFRNCINVGLVRGLGKCLPVASSKQRKTGKVRSVPKAGIGCSSKMMSAIDVYGFHGIHGRALPIALQLYDNMFCVCISWINRFWQ